MRGVAKPRWTSAERAVLDKLYPSATPEEIQVAIPTRTWTQIKESATYRNLKLHRSNYKSDLTPLLQNTPEALYWMGFLCADGHFGDSILSVELSIKDRPHLLKLCSFIQFPPESLGSRCREVFGGSFSQVGLSTSHKEVMIPLKAKYGITSQKTQTPIDLSCLSPTEILHFLIGFIDGDGSICKRKDGSTVISIEISKNWEPVLNLFRDTLLAMGVPIKAAVRLYTRKDTGQTFCRWQVVHPQMHSLLKQAAIDTKLPILLRKWDNI